MPFLKLFGKTPKLWKYFFTKLFQEIYSTPPPLYLAVPKAGGKFLGQGSDLSHSSDPNHSNDNCWILYH